MYTKRKKIQQHDLIYGEKVKNDIPQRDYYSELVADMSREDPSKTICAKKRMKLILQAKTEKLAPTLVSLPKPQRVKVLLPPGRWTTYREDETIQFPFETFVPKLQFLSIALPKELPRLVKIERLRRKFLAANIKKRLRELGIQPYILLPVDEFRVDTQEYYSLYSPFPKLDLEIFDNTDFDCRIPEEWMSLGMIEGELHPCPGLAFIPKLGLTSLSGDYMHQLNNIYEWTNVAAIDYDYKTEKWTVMALDGSKRRYSIPRIRLMFKADDPETFAMRIKFAVDFRKEIENNLRFYLYLDCLMLNALPEIPDLFMSNIMKMVLIYGQFKEAPEPLLSTLKQEVLYLYQKIEGKMKIIFTIQKYPNLYNFIDVPTKDYVPPVPDYGRYPCVMENFWERAAHNQWYSLFVLIESVACKHLVIEECLRVESMLFFTTNFGRNVSLAEFDAAQQHCTSMMLKYLTITWLANTAHAIRMSFRDVGKGWFNIYEKKFKFYCVSKIARFMQLVRFRMQYALRYCIEQSMAMFVNMCETPCLCTYDCDDDYEWDSSDLINSPFRSIVTLFYFHLLMSEDGPYYSTDPAQFEIVIQRLFREMLYRSHFIPQVHPMIMTGLVFDKDLYLTSIGLNEPNAVEYRERLIKAYRKAIIPLKAYIKQYEEYKDIYKLNIDTYVQNYRQEVHSHVETQAEIQLHYDAKQLLIERLPQYINIGPFAVNVDSLKQQLVTKRTNIMKALLVMWCEEARVVVDDVIDAYKSIMRKLGEKPNTIEHVFEIREWMESIPFALKTQDDIMKKVNINSEVLEVFYYPMDNDDFAALWEAIGWPLNINKQVEATIQLLEEEQEKFWKLHQQDEQVMYDKIDLFTQQCMQLSLQNDFSKVHEVANDIKKAWKGMKESQDWGRVLNARQKLFGQPVVPFTELNKLVKEFEPYRNLWVTASDFLKAREIWLDNPLMYVDADAIEPLTNDYYKTIIKCVRTFADMPKVQHVGNVIRDAIDDFRPLIPIIQAVRNPGMKERHWNEFMEKSGITVTMNDKQTFQMCIKQGLAEYGELISEIGELATKEYVIEQSLDKMLSEWSNKTLELTPYKNTGTYIMKIADETLQLLDEHLLGTQQLGFSPFKAAFELRIQEWDDKLHLTQKVVEEWIECQKEWMYLEPIFASEDISRQLPAEAKKYGTMERIWRRTMSSAVACPKIMVICPDSRLLDSLVEARHLLDVVYRGLNCYMELKRLRFPRFFFLSDDELLEILSQSRNPRAVQPHLRKCFENIAKVTFQPDLKITHMHSSEGEIVELKYQFYPTANVEQWLLLLEDTMRNTIRLTLIAGLEELWQIPRQEWVLRWPGQVVIAGSQTAWTAGVETSIEEYRVEEFFSEMLGQLESLRALVKSDLTFSQREVLCALIVIEVHARDVTHTLVDENVRNVSDFQWICQLRYYSNVEDMDMEPLESGNLPEIYQDETHLDTSAYYRQFSQNTCDVRALNSVFTYQNEYLGNSGRLVITPLTDRCYLTLMCAMHLKFGGAPAGPAGTGKTETTKDLAKALAVQCVVFNCSDQLDFMAMGKFFKGLAASGAWACFDEFNRIDIEVLSVVAQQVVTIQKAQIARQERFMFEGVDLPLKASCSVFITMNPGYAGRTELPDNLKALFRPIAMMVPDYALIAEISLFSFGFGEAKILAGKITTTFRLSSEQLSAQDHYDFGMRAVKTVITVAGNLIRQMPNGDERQIVLRALRDVNVPKFLVDDLLLFNGIISDLFPRVEIPIVDYGIMEQSIRNMLVKRGYDDLYPFVFKVIQLYETTVVRHGLMLVGPAGAGKTKCYEVLRDALTAIKGKLAPDGFPFTPVHTFVVNPKSITMGQLYGEFDLQTHEWTDGILSSLVRDGIAVEDMDKRWYVFDGPVDAVWIENMNTVLDDNKKLCLSSGEIMKLTERQRMIFEVADLAVASPATVSRCGMVYLDTQVVGLPPLVNAWLKSNLPSLADNIRKTLPGLINTYLYPALELLRERLTEIVVSIDSSLVLKFLELLDFRLRPLTGKDDKPPPGAPFLALMPRLAPLWVVWSVIWSVGATCDHNGRAIFSDFIREKTVEAGLKPLFPAKGRVYDYTLHDGGFTDTTEDGEPAAPYWYNWMANIGEYQVDPEWQYADIEVPTMDNVRSAAILGYKIQNWNHVICVGPTGTGKTVTISAKLSHGLNKKFICEFLVFSARTSANQTQDVIDSKLDRRRRGVFGPPPTKRQVFFIDDLNMPALEVYGAQPPIELLRQFMDFSGWYDRHNIGEFKTLVDVGIVAAMGPPGGGRNPVTMRLMRHFHYISFTEMEYSSKYSIFSVILKSWTRDINPKVTVREAPFLTASLDIFTQLVVELLPTPVKSHYTFNLRDLSKVFQGMLMVDPQVILEENDVIRLWYHEHLRVYQDRLVNDEDRKWFKSLLDKKIRTDFGKKPNDVIGGRLMLFGDFMDIGAEDRKYIEINDREELYEILGHYKNDYNMSTTVPLDLVLFDDAIAHLCRIARIMRQPMANALLLGMGGSGRQSLSRLAASMAELTCVQIEITKVYGNQEWRDDLKQTMLKAGADNRGVVFLFSDAQIKMESFLEDLNNILSSGDVPNIYEAEDLDKIYQSVRHVVMEMNLVATKTNLFSCYQRRVRSNLHIVIVMSPIGEIFRSRLRQFPSLVNCCTIDWYSEWPKTALESVAKHFFTGMGELQSVSNEIIDAMVSVCCFAHQSVVEASHKFEHQLNRINYVTPMSYMSMLNAYSEMFKKKRQSIYEESNALKTGLGKLNQTEIEVKELQIELAELKPLMEQAAEETRKVIEQIAIDTEIAEEARAKVEQEQIVAEQMATLTAAMAEDAMKDLEEAMPALRAAEKALQELNRNDIVEVKAMKKPPQGVVLVIESLCVVFDIKPVKEPGPNFGEKTLNYWKPGSLMLSDPGAFLESLMNFDKDSITEDMIKKLKRFIVNPDYDPAKIVRVSKACQSLCMWVHAMYKFYHVNLAVKPKKEALEKAQQGLAAVQEMLANAKAKMQALLEGIAKLNEYLKEKEEEKRKMEEDINLCLERMDRANRLLNGLSSERVRWIKTIKELDIAIVNLIGDILLSACAVGYITPFTDEFRRELSAEWMQHIQEVKVPHTPGATPLSTLGDAVQIRTWQMYGLPRDLMSVESAVLIYNSRRWPLIIDPQTQANKWIRAMGKIEGLIVCKPNDRDLLRSFESALRFGKPLLLENVGQELDPALDPVLKRQYFRQAGQLVLKFGDSLIPFIAGFRLYMTTKLPNPRYTPETSVKVQIVNFALVPSGLSEQLLSTVVAQERPDLEELRGQLIVSRAQLAAQLAEMQADILYGLSNSEGSPVDDLPLISTLEAIKMKSAEIIIKVEDIERTTSEIDAARQDYVPVANRGQILFFCLSDMAHVDPMYQYSLEWFVKLFIRSMAETEPHEEIIERVEIIIEHFTFLLYSNVCRSLFERHKLLFAFLVCVRILLDKGVIKLTEFNFLLTGGKIEEDMPNPDPRWISDRMWNEIQQLNHSVPTMNTFMDDFMNKNTRFYRNLYESNIPHKLTYPKNSQLDVFQKLLVLKCIRPDKLIPALQDYVVMGLGARFVEPQPADLAALYAESDPLAPIIFVLSTGTDPAADLMKFADKMKMGKRFQSISLGQGQGPLAENMMKAGCDFGNWVFFQNCHLSPSWMPVLELNVEHIAPELVHKDFRLWLTSTPSPFFPVALLQNGYKMTVEPPRGIKANLLKAYMNQVPDFTDYFNSTDTKVPNFKWLLFSLCLFHGVVLERRKFGPLGFNIPYEFTDGDLRICMSQLYMFLNEYTEVPLRMLTYTAGHINYGGRVTDDWDRRCLLNILVDYYSPAVLNERYVFDETGAYKQRPSSTSIEDYTKYIRALPLNDDPALFGLHANANISYAMFETQACLSTLLNLQPKEAAREGGATVEEIIEKAAIDILEDLPEPLDTHHITLTYPVSYKESLNTVLIQESLRYNRLLAVIKNSLRDLLKALKGLVVMSEALELMGGSLSRNIVPNLWSAKAYPSLKPLAAWTKDLILRVAFMREWADKGIPKVFWISGFYFPQAFLTGALQNYARKHVIAIDTVAYTFEALQSAPSKKPEDGCCVHGLYLEGARFSLTDMSLEESKAKELYTEMPILYMKPEQNHKLKEGLYECPTYKTLLRAGTLSTTGHSTNYVMTIEIPTHKPPSHWIKRGVALFCALNY